MLKKNHLVPKRIHLLRLTLFSLLTIALLALIFTATSAVYFFNQQHLLSSKYFNLKVLAQDIALHDEILTMSTLVASHDGDPKWKQRYEKYEASLDDLLLTASATDPNISKFFQETADANMRLVKIEKLAFEFIQSGEPREALALLRSDEYRTLKQGFSAGIASAIDEVLKETQSSLDKSESERGRYLLLSMFSSFMIVLVLWYFLIRYVRITDQAIGSKATTDELSGLLNRREFNRVLPIELNRAQRENRILMLTILDLDNFKKFNDSYGHPKGDEVINKIGNLLQTLSRRANESAFRVGGEEFIFLATCDTHSDATRLTQTICSRVFELNIPHEQNLPFKRVTASCGVAVSDTNQILTADELYSRADKALYNAKHTGKNTFALFDHSALNTAE
ncbi:GGDEF domain-containing protein [Alteromonas sp. ASW11-36]|uniref:diguanylate cyclase n=1 Tax=Alteromonas arenosi TaxID=3055817 RepID=A0ABT7SUL1_9ALTE|nr:GGDEF domain-containing protein [Alteromonas sp. ASW11-36]MDM7859878.1 GGDEF domain-containing protein [Alteromonas sp. ASW11-36]